MVPVLSIILIVINMIMGILVPVGLLLYLKKKFGASVKCFFTGCAVMLLFAFVLEQIVHSLVLGSQAGTAIKENIWMYAVYGSLMAGLFEETGRFIAMRHVLKKESRDAHNALMYGAGHGGFEMFVILSIGMINNLIYSVMIDLGQTQTLLAPLNEAAGDTLLEAFDTLIHTPSWHFMLISVERFAAVTAHIGLSVIVWFAAAGKKARASLFFFAIMLHAVLNFMAVMAAQSGISLILVEAIVWMIAVGIAAVAAAIWKKEKRRLNAEG